jgi:hypothetical protein
MTRPPLATAAALVSLSAFVAWQVQIGADALWPVALGRLIVHGGGLPSGVPFAAADSSGWANVPVLGELVLTAVAALGDRALAVFQIAADLLALGLLAGAALRRGAADTRVALAVVLAVLAGAPALVILRLQVLSLVPFALVVILLHREHDRPSRGIWLLPVVVAVWTNLHGAVLLGVAVSGCYLLLSRLWVDRRETVLVGVATVLALAVNPAGPRTVHYYLGVLSNEAANRGEGLWAHPSLSSPLDVVMLLGLAGAVILAFRRRQPLWVYAAVLGLGLATLSAVRNGVWLGMLLVLPATAPRRSDVVDPGRGPALSRPAWAAGLLGWAGVAALVTTGVLLARSQPVDTTPPGLVDAIREEAGARPVLAPEPLVERLAASGVTVWVSNPIDAFSAADQVAYLDFLDGRPGGRRALDAVRVVVVEAGSDPERLVVSDPRWRAGQSVEGWTAYTR